MQYQQFLILIIRGIHLYYIAIQKIMYVTKQAAGITYNCVIEKKYQTLTEILRKYKL